MQRGHDERRYRSPITKLSRPPLSPTMMPNLLWSDNWCSGWPVCFGGYAVPPRETGLFEIEAGHLSEEGQTHQTSPASRQVVRSDLTAWSILLAAFQHAA